MVRAVCMEDARKIAGLGYAGLHIDVPRFVARKKLAIAQASGTVRDRGLGQEILDALHV